MPPVAKLNLIPVRIRLQLDERLRERGFGEIEATTAWLREQGIDVGKTTVGDYAQRLKRAAELDLSSLGLNQVGVLRVRLQCAQIAATAGGDNLVERAEQVLAWAAEPVASAARAGRTRVDPDDGDNDDD